MGQTWGGACRSRVLGAQGCTLSTYPGIWMLWLFLFCFSQLPILRTQEKKEELSWEGCGTNQAEIVKGQVRGTTYLWKRGGWSCGRIFDFICMSDSSPDSALVCLFALSPWSRRILFDYPLVPISSCVHFLTSYRKGTIW